VAAWVEAAAVEVGPGEVGEVVVDPMADPGRGEEVGVVRATTTTIPAEVPVVVQDVAVAAVEGQEGDEEEHHPHPPPGHLHPQTTYRTRNFSLVSPSFALRLLGPNLVTHRRRSPTTTTPQTS